MKKLIKCSLLLVVLFCMVFLTSCGDQKSPDKGYITSEELDEIVNKFDGSVEYNKYTYEGNLNYFNYEDLIIPRDVYMSNVDFIDSKDKYNDKCASYYLNLPLHITKENWVCEEVDSHNRSLSTKYCLTDKVYRSAGLDEIYFYKREGGGFILKTFAVNKALRIIRPSDITCHGKWNIEVEYDQNGYLISEKFSTLKADKKKKQDSCYGQATYTYQNA